MRHLLRAEYTRMMIDETKPYILTEPDVLTPDECRTLIERIERAGPTVATINTFSGPRIRTDVRNNDRVIFDDEELAATLLERVRHRVPEEIHGMQIAGANERFRCYRYLPGMRFAPHADGPFVRNENERSVYTLIVYFNDDFEGGSTAFLVDPEVSITPRTGMALLFQHPIIHEGSLVTSGTKYVARTDVMYRLPNSAKSAGQPPKAP